MQCYYPFYSSVTASLSLEELFGQIMGSSLITAQEQQQLLHALESHCLSEDETAIVHRLFYNIRRGWIQVINDSIDLN